LRRFRMHTYRTLARWSIWRTEINRNWGCLG
jgi:hypothetical protein